MADSRATSTLLPLPPRGHMRRYDDDASTLAVLNAFGEGTSSSSVKLCWGRVWSGMLGLTHTARNYGRPWSTLAELTTVGQSRVRQNQQPKSPHK